MNGPLYPAARAFAPRLREHFERLRSDAAGAASSAAAPPRTVPLPDAEAIEALIDAAFWASLQREEGRVPEISLAYLAPGTANRPLLLARPLPLGPRALARLSPAVERPGIHLGVWPEGRDLLVWGTTRVVPSSCFVLEVLGPGLLVVKTRAREDSVKFRNLAVFEGEQVKIVRRQATEVADHPAVLQSLLAPELSHEADDSVEVLLRLAVSMRAHRRGGTLLVVPAGSEAWRESIVQPLTYPVDPPFGELRERMAEALEQGPGSGAALSKVVELVAGLTAVDGATLITDQYDLLGFGVKIGRPDGRPRVERVVLTEPIEGAEKTVVAPLALGGTRHNSAAQFAQDQPDAVALVASQDGRFTLFAWSPSEGMVHAHRVETLLL